MIRFNQENDYWIQLDLYLIFKSKINFTKRKKNIKKVLIDIQNDV